MLMLFPLNFNSTITKRGGSGGNNSVLAFSAHHQRLKAEMGLFLNFTMPLVASLLNYSVPSLSSTILMCDALMARLLLNDYLSKSFRLCLSGW